MIEAAYEDELVGRNGNVTGLIFSLKNNFSWTDKQEMKHEGGITVNIVPASEYVDQDDTDK
jgi:hypothetical protein